MTESVSAPQMLHAISGKIQQVAQKYLNFILIQLSRPPFQFPRKLSVPMAEGG